MRCSSTVSTGAPCSETKADHTCTNHPHDCAVNGHHRCLCGHGWRATMGERTTNAGYKQTVFCADCSTALVAGVGVRVLLKEATLYCLHQ